MAKRKKAVAGIVDRGRLQPSSAGNAGAVLSHGFKKGSDKSAPRHKLNVAEYSPRYKGAVSRIDAILKRKG